jgi:hypothetical protein
LTLAQLAFLAYNFVLHAQSLVFCAQLTIALWWMTRGIRAVRARATLTADLEAKELRRKFGHHHTPSSSSLSASVASGSLSSYTSDSEEEGKSMYAMQDFIDSLGEVVAPEERVVHAIVVPNYMEDLGTLRETLDVLASHRRARTQYEVRLFSLHWRNFCANSWDESKFRHHQELHGRSRAGGSTRLGCAHAMRAKGTAIQPSRSIG